MTRLPVFALGIIVLAGCGDGRVAGPALGASFSRNLPAPGARAVSVMTRNLYLGADLTPVITASTFPQLVAAATVAFATIQGTNFPERAEALAAEIAAANPHLIGLQEVERYDVFPPSGGAPLMTIDFLDILGDALAERGLSYQVAAVHNGFSAGAPGFVGGGLAIIQLTDRDVILSREDVATTNGDGASFEAKVTVSIPTPTGSVDLPIPRGWAAVTATVAGVTFRFVNTHLETQGFPDVQGNQVHELLADVIGAQSPVILVGDFNSAANVFQTETYGSIVDAGFVDSWAQAEPRDVGLTCCQAEKLDNVVSQLDQRLDIVFLRDPLTALTGRITGGVHADVVGEEQADRTPSGLWPSDHAGVATTFNVPLQVARN